MGKPTKVRTKGEHYIDLRLWHSATYLLELGVHRKTGSFHPLLAASVFSFFAFEAFLNEVGRQLDPTVWNRERDFFARGKYRGTLGKFKYLAEKTGFAYRADARPFQTVHSLATVRDALAHGRTEAFDVKVSVKRADSNDPMPTIDQWGRVSFAKRALADVEEIADGLMAAAKEKFGEWSAGYRSSAFCGIYGFREIHSD